MADALTAVPLLVAFWLARKPANDRYTYGYGRAEDLAGLFIVAMIALSSMLAAYEAIRRLLDPEPVTHLADGRPWVDASAVVRDHIAALDTPTVVRTSSRRASSAGTGLPETSSP